MEPAVGAGCGRAASAEVCASCHARAGPHQVDGGESQEQREGGDDFEVDDGLEADAAHALEVAAAGDANHQRAEYQGRDDGADQPQKDGADGSQLARHAGREGSQSHPRGHADEDPGGQR